MSLTTAAISGTTWSFPRVSGDEPPQVWLLGTPPQFSPRERG